MNVIPVALGIAVGINLFAGLIFLIIGLSRRPRDWTNVTFALLSFSIAGNTISVLAIHTARSVDEYVTAFKFGFGLTSLMVIITLMWFMAFYSEVKPRFFLLGMSLWFTFIIVLHIIFPFGILFDRINALRTIIFPWGEQVIIHQATPHPWRILVDLFLLTMFGFFFYATYHKYREGDRRQALLLGLVIFLLFIANIHDTLVDTGIVNFIYIMEFAFLGIVIMMSIDLSHGILHTETELKNYQQHLEVLVDERTAEIKRSSENLAGEIVERKQVEADLHQRVVELAILHQISQVVTTTSDLLSALQSISEIITELFGARYTHVVILAPVVGEQDILVGFDRESGSIGQTHIDVSLDDMPLTRQVLDRGESLVSSDVQFLSWSPSVSGFLLKHLVQCIMLVPFRVLGEVAGFLVITTDQAGRTFTKDELGLAETVAGDVSNAMESTRLQEQEREAAATEERSRLARDLHDAVTQTIYSASLIAEMLPRVWERNPEEGKRSLIKLRQLVRGALGEMRTLLFELRPDALATADLETLLGQLGNAFTGRTRVPVDMTVEGDCVIPENVKIALYRITQEVFNNIAKHSGANRVYTTLQVGEERVILAIRDNGMGFDPETTSADRMGLKIFHERAEEIGARLEIESKPGEGTFIKVEWRKMTEDQGL